MVRIHALYIILFSPKPVMQIAVRLITGNPLYMLVHACQSRVQNAFKRTNSRIDIVTVECESNVKEQSLTTEQLTIAYAKP